MKVSVAALICSLAAAQGAAAQESAIDLLLGRVIREFRVGPLPTKPFEETPKFDPARKIYRSPLGQRLPGALENLMALQSVFPLARENEMLGVPGDRSAPDLPTPHADQQSLEDRSKTIEKIVPSSVPSGLPIAERSNIKLQK